MPGMIVQCSVCGGLAGSLQRGMVKSLRGNKLYTPASYKARSESYTYWPTTSDSGDTAFYASAPYATPYAALMAFMSTHPPIFNADGGYDTASATLLASGFNWATAARTSAEAITQTPTTWNYGVGWTWTGGYAYVYLMLAKNTTGAMQPYFIVRYRGTTGHTGCASGVTVTNYQLDLVSQGLVSPNQTIGWNGDIPITWPTTTPASFTNFGGGMLANDLYCPIIGQDPKTWATANGLSFGTVTYVT